MQLDEPCSKRRLGRKMRWAVGLIGSLFLLILVGLLYERFTGSIHLTRYTATLRSQGETLLVSDLEPKDRPGPANNLVVDLLSLSNFIHLAGQTLDSAPPSSKMVRPGLRVVPHRLAHWYPDKKQTNTWEHFGADLEKQSEWVEKFRVALNQKSGFDFGVDYHGDFTMPHYEGLIQIKALHRVLCNSALLGLHREQKERALSDLIDSIHLLSRQNSERFLIVQMVRQACFALSFSTLWAVLEEPGWTEQQLSEIQNAWTPLDMLGDLGKSLRMERAMLVNYAQLVQTSHDHRQRMFDGSWVMRVPSGDIDWPAQCLFQMRAVQSPLWRFAWKDEDLLRGLQRSQLLIDRYDRGVLKGWSQSQLTNHVVNRVPSIDWFPFAGDTPVSAFDRFRFPLLTLTSGIPDTLVERVLRYQTQHQIMLVAVACHRYRLTAGVWPESMSAMIPKFMPSEPRDWLGGGKLIYRRDASRGFLLYSKGSDGIDDGGDPSLPDGKDPSSDNLQDKGKDWVWPAAATPEESEAALRN